MSKPVKIVLTVVIIFVFSGLFGAVAGIRTDAGHTTPGFLGIVFFALLIWALRRVWKKNDSTDKND